LYVFHEYYRKQVISKQREYQKKKKQKKLQRYKQMEEEREGEKNKWLAFNSKVSTLFGTVIVTNSSRGEFILRS